MHAWCTFQSCQQRPWSHPVCRAIGWQRLQRVTSRHVKALCELYRVCVYFDIFITRALHVSLLLTSERESGGKGCVLRNVKGTFIGMSERERVRVCAREGG